MSAFQPHGFIINPGMELEYHRIETDALETHARRLTQSVLDGLIQEYGGGDFTSKVHLVNDETLTEADNLVHFWQYSTWKLMICIIREGKISDSKQNDWSTSRAEQAEKELIDYCIEYFHKKDRNSILSYRVLPMWAQGGDFGVVYTVVVSWKAWAARQTLGPLGRRITISTLETSKAQRLSRCT
jgi:hypothetical protein